jgi:MFS family permease
MCLLGTSIGCLAQDYNTFLAGRMIQGLGACAYESLLIAIVGDLYFVHERGLRIAFFNFCFANLNAIGTLIAGPITTKLGWRYMFYIYIPFIAIQFNSSSSSFVPPKQHCSEDRRTKQISSPMLTTMNCRDKKPEKPNLPAVPTAHLEEANGNAEISTIPAKKTYWQYISLYHGRQSHDNPIKLFLRPFAICLNPAVIWVSFAPKMVVCKSS